MLTVMTYLVYLGLSAALIGGVSMAVYLYGRELLEDSFDGDSALSDSVGRLLVLGVATLTAGYAFQRLGGALAIFHTEDALVYLGRKLGSVIVILGILQYLHLHIISRIRHRRHTKPAAQPAAEPASS